jgi:hypothetical protein
MLLCFFAAPMFAFEFIKERFQRLSFDLNNKINKVRVHYAASNYQVCSRKEMTSPFLIS